MRRSLMRLVAASGLMPGMMVTLAPEARAAVASGSMQGGPGAASCIATVSCLAFTRTCSVPPANNVDASIVSASGLAGQTWPFGWQAAAAGGVRRIVIETFNSGCGQTSFTTVDGATSNVHIPGGSAWIVLYPSTLAVDIDWSFG